MIQPLLPGENQHPNTLGTADQFFSISERDTRHWLHQKNTIHRGKCAKVHAVEPPTNEVFPPFN